MVMTLVRQWFVINHSIGSGFPISAIWLILTLIRSYECHYIDQFSTVAGNSYGRNIVGFFR